MLSQSRHENFSRTCWITFHWRGTTSSVSVTSSPSLDRRLPPQHGQAAGPRTITRSRGRWEGLARWPRLPGEGRHLGRPGGCSLCCQLVLRRRGLELLELELELVEQIASDAIQPGTPLGALAELLAAELLDLQLQVDDQRLIVGCPGSQACRFGSYSGSVRARHSQLLGARQ